MKTLNIAITVILLIGIVFTGILFLSDFSEFKKTVGSSLYYYITISLLVGIFLSIRELIKSNKK